MEIRCQLARLWSVRSVFAGVLLAAVLSACSSPEKRAQEQASPIYMREHINSRWMNYIVAGIVTLACLLAVVAVPLQIFGA